jgi:hypothetical protein
MKKKSQQSKHKLQLLSKIQYNKSPLSKKLIVHQQNKQKQIGLSKRTQTTVNLIYQKYKNPVLNKNQLNKMIRNRKFLMIRKNLI